MAGVLGGECSYNESGVSSHSRNPNENQDEVSRWYFGRKEIEEDSPSRLDKIDLKKETYLRKSYCTFLQDLGMKLKVPQITIATSIIFCHRFFIRQSHARNDRRTIATVCMFLAGKVEETPRPLKDVIVVSYEIIHKKDAVTAQKIKQKEVYEQQKELILSGEKIVLSTLGFDFNVNHPYKPLVEAIKKFKVAQNALAQVAWNFVNDGLRTSLCLQFKPHHIAAGAIFLAAKFLKVKLPSDGEKVWWQEFDVTPRQLEEVSNQMLELYEQNSVPATQVSEVESSVGGGSAHQVGSRPISARPAHEHSNSDNPGGSSKATQNKSNDNGSGEAGSVITEHTETHQADQSRTQVEAAHGKDKTERIGAHLPDETVPLDKSRSVVNSGDAPVSQSPKDIKLLRDKVRANLEAKKSQGEKTKKKNVIDEDDLIERELEDVELAVDDARDNQKKIGTEHGEILDGNNLVGNTEEGEMVDDVSSTVPSRKRKMESTSEKQLGEGKKQHLDNIEDAVEEGQKTSHNSHVNSIFFFRAFVYSRSRICVKNLPKEVAEARLRDVFSKKGEITDAKLLRSKENGKSRQMAFIGFRSEQEAQEAIKYFNNSYLDTFRISVEIARRVGDENAPRPWSRHSLKKVEEKLKEDSEKNKKKSKKEQEVDDPMREEFLDVMLRGKSKIWSNDTSVAPSVKVAKKEKVLVKKADDEPVVSSDGKMSSDSDKKSKKRSVVAPTDDVDDLEYFKSRVKKNLSDSDSDSESGSDEDEADDDDDDDGEAEGHDGEAEGHDGDVGLFPVENDGDDDAMEVEKEEDDKMAQDSKADSDDVLQTGRLFVRNLPYTTTEEELREHFKPYGEISEVHLVLDRETKRSKGVAYILYQVPEDAARAMEVLDNDFFQGRLLHVMPSKPRLTSDKQMDDTSNLPKTFKQKKEEARKASEAGGNTKAWNSLFMRQDTILENTVRMYGVSKSELLDREADDPAVRLALAETKVIAETKEALAKAGVNVTSLEEFATGKGGEKSRSKHILLVKNLPFASTEKELAQMFGKFGIEKIILPPTKTMALVVFLEPTDARTAIQKMAYKRYKDAPLYLEWAPEDILEPKTVRENNEEKSDAGVNDMRRVNLEQEINIDPDVTESNVLHIKDLSFKTTDESLKKHLEALVKHGKILSVNIPKHVKNGKNVSRGYGFVEFDSVETATSVIRDLQGTSLHGHPLQLRFTEHKRRDTVAKVSEKMSTKLHVKNIAFEATEKELRQLFSPFGQIKGLRLPKRNIGQYAGYGFVEFMTKQEASNAKKALSSTHFYGRHLVIEWAKDDDSMEEKRRRSAAKYEENNAPKRRRTAE
ncbi:unnamed protein product [Eruca vesicaria subsp. sativa]|uniref:RRM domain-containing protein n=1 Tax=Eruca vesicaria subsp. sativa TaxID=29727 RepID=A0ABC8JYM6_ERUVS|nr:unnamed protein product [Eruca vesicaria subsp. sativa]